MLILASQSASRQAMLRAAGVAFEAVPAHLDEQAITQSMHEQTVQQVAERLAALKALSVSESHQHALVLGSDSMLEVADGEWLDKPGSLAGLADQLRRLRGTTHRLISAAAIAKQGKILWHCCETAQLHVRPFSEDWLQAYLQQAGADVLNSVGGYHLEGLGVQLFSAVDGDQFVVRGLPLLSVLQFLRAEGQLLA